MNFGVATQAPIARGEVIQIYLDGVSARATGKGFV